MSKTRDDNLPQHDYNQGHYGELPLTALPTSGTNVGDTFIYDGAEWGFGPGGSGSTVSGSVFELFQGDGSDFENSLGGWVATSATMTRDTSIKWRENDASLKFVTDASGDRVDTVVSGTFLEGHMYQVMIPMLVEQNIGSTVSVNFGDLSTSNFGIAGVILPSGTPMSWYFTTADWVPSVDFSNPSVRVECTSSGAATRSFHIGAVKIIETAGGVGLQLQRKLSDDHVYYLGNQGLGFYGGPDGQTYSDKILMLPGFTSITVGSGGPTGMLWEADSLLQWSEAGGNTGDRNGWGLNFEVGPDYIGLFMSELDSNTLQIYPDYGDYDIELLDGDGSGGGSTGRWYAVDKFGNRRALSAAAGSGSHTHVYSEVPAGTVNGSNATFTLASTPTAGSVLLYKNGLRQKAGGGNDYTLATDTITFLAGNIPQTGDNLLADYET